MNVHQRVFEVQRGLFVEFLVLLLFHLLPRRTPQGGLLVDRILTLAHIDGKPDVIGMFVDDVLDPIFICKLGRVFLELDLHLRPALAHLRRADLVVVLAGGVPANGFGLGFGGPGCHAYPFRHHKYRIEAHTELSDHLGEIHFLVLRRFDELARPRLGNGPQVFDDLIMRHADARILDRQQAVFLIYRDLDLQLGIRVYHIPVGDHLEAQAIQRIGGVREQLAQEHLPILIQGMDEYVEKLLGLGFERKLLDIIRGCGWSCVCHFFLLR